MTFPAPSRRVGEGLSHPSFLCTKASQSKGPDRQSVLTLGDVARDKSIDSLRNRSTSVITRAGISEEPDIASAIESTVPVDRIDWQGVRSQAEVRKSTEAPTTARIAPDNRPRHRRNRHQDRRRGEAWRRNSNTKLGLELLRRSNATARIPTNSQRLPHDGLHDRYSSRSGFLELTSAARRGSSAAKPREPGHPYVGTSEIGSSILDSCLSSLRKMGKTVNSALLPTEVHLGTVEQSTRSVDQGSLVDFEIAVDVPFHPEQLLGDR